MIDEMTLGRGRKVLGFRELVDKNTGEVVLTNEIVSELKDVNWEKVWMKNLLFAVNLVGDKSMQVLAYFLENRDLENKVLANKQMIVDHTGISRITVYRIVKKLIENDIVRELPLGYQVNPNVVFNTGKASKRNINRLDVIMSYSNIGIEKVKKIHEKE